MCKQTFKTRAVEQSNEAYLFPIVSFFFFLFSFKKEPTTKFQDRKDSKSTLLNSNSKAAKLYNLYCYEIIQMP